MKEIVKRILIAIAFFIALLIIVTMVNLSIAWLKSQFGEFKVAIGSLIFVFIVIVAAVFYDRSGQKEALKEMEAFRKSYNQYDPKRIAKKYKVSEDKAKKVIKHYLSLPKDINNGNASIDDFIDKMNVGIKEFLKE